MEQLTETVWIHTTLYQVGNREVPSNGLVILAGTGAVLVDTPWTEGQTEVLLDTVRDRLGQPVRAAVFTHAHRDRMGGIHTLKAHSIESWCLDKTATEAMRNGFETPENRLVSGARLPIDGVEAEIFYPGPAHSPDNAVIWFPEEQILFGGCMVKAMESQDITLVSDSDALGWLPALQAVLERYPSPQWVVPGHGACGGPELLQHTVELLSQANDGDSYEKHSDADSD